MAFVFLPNQEAYAAWQKLSRSLGCPCTYLAGHDARPVLAVPDTVLDELAEHGIAFTVLDEAQLPRHLSAGGLAYYRNLRRDRPEYLDWNVPLPPALHVAMSCNVAEVHVEAVRRIVERYQPVSVRTTEVSVIAITTEPDDAEEVPNLVKVEFIVPRVHQRALMEELMASGAAGTSRATAIYVQSDPDGPPGRET